MWASTPQRAGVWPHGPAGACASAMTVRHNEASPWVQLISDDDEAYYYNERTDETTWEEPYL